MTITVKGHNVETSDALRQRINERLDEISQKYFNRITGADVTFGREGHHLFTCHVTFQVGRGVMVNADGSHADAYIAFEEAADRIARQLRRYKDRLKDHSAREDIGTEIAAHDYVLETTTMDTAPSASDPVIVAEMVTNIQTMTVAEAVMRLDLSKQNALLFNNAKHGALNLVYRRTDGNIGWIDPENAKSASKAA